MQTNTDSSTAEVSLIPPVSRRFASYMRDGSLRGRSLALANALEQFKKDARFQEFQIDLVEAIIKIRERGRRSPEADRQRVLQILAQFPSTLEEISEDMNIPKKEARLIIDGLLKEGSIDQKEQQHWHADGYHYTPFYRLPNA